MLNNIKKIIFLRYINENGFSQWHDDQFVSELLKTGVSISIFEFPKTGLACKKTLNALELSLKQSQPGDVILSCLFDDIQIDNDIFSLIQASTIPSITLCFDNLQVWHRHKKSANIYDILWITSPDTEKHFASVSSQIIYMPYAANPYRDNSIQRTWQKSLSDIVFIGNPYGARGDYIKTLIDNRVPIKCYGGGPKRKSVKENKLNSRQLVPKTILTTSFDRIVTAVRMMSDPNGRKLLHGGLIKRFHSNSQCAVEFNSLEYNEYEAVVSSSKLVLNSAIVWNTHLTSRPLFKGHLRIFETAAFAGAQLIEDYNELRNWFVPGKEIITFTSSNELVDLAKFYLRSKNEHLLIDIKRRAHERVVSEHTWLHRFSKIDKML